MPPPAQGATNAPLDTLALKDKVFVAEKRLEFVLNACSKLSIISLKDDEKGFCALLKFSKLCAVVFAICVAILLIGKSFQK